ncbi:MAG TPA: LLM class F420-dependent oxidoreductase [Solirubrobacterales bacterium]|nr:LLM class F420-dependent oxidoreductase [Solirubrobacterales bacterium]
MKFGLTIFPTAETIQPALLARRAEELGFESLWFPEHTHIPVSRDTPYPGGGDLPDEYARIYDPFVALTAAAAATDRLLVGTGICLIVERDPITTAKEVATIDRVSGGRFLFGIGAGWNLEEMANHGTDPRTRFSLMRERIEAMKEIWTADEASYHGRHVDFEPIWSWPKPVQRPHPPILVGGNSDGALDRVVALADEWIPNPETRLRELPEWIADLQERAAAAGRDRIPVTFYAVKPEVEALRRFAAAGVDRAVFYLPPASAEQVEPYLDHLAALAAELGPT